MSRSYLDDDDENNLVLYDEAEGMGVEDIPEAVDDESDDDSEDETERPSSRCAPDSVSRTSTEAQIPLYATTLPEQTGRFC